MKATEFKNARLAKVQKDKQTGCGKIPYRSEDRAWQRATSAHDTRGSYVAYKCPNGKHWHIGHPTPGTKLAQQLPQTKANTDVQKNAKG